MPLWASAVVLYDRWAAEFYPLLCLSILRPDNPAPSSSSVNSIDAGAIKSAGSLVRLFLTGLILFGISRFTPFILSNFLWTFASIYRYASSYDSPSSLRLLWAFLPFSSKTGLISWFVWSLSASTSYSLGTGLFFFFLNKFVLSDLRPMLAITSSLVATLTWFLEGFGGLRVDSDSTSSFSCDPCLFISVLDLSLRK